MTSAIDPSSVKTRGLLIVTLSYVIALGAGWATVAFAPIEDVLLRTLAADLVATIVIFGWSVAYDNSSFYDAYWSVAPIPIVFYWAFHPAGLEGPWLRQALVLGGVSAWGLRLTYNWARGWHGLSHEDWRYVDKREQTGKLYWGVSFTGLHMMPTLLVFLGCLAAVPAVMTGTQPLSVVDALATVVMAGAIWLEATADNQLRAFRLSNPPPEAILETGLWARCRHPNYLGEILFWWGLCLFGFAATSAYPWIVVGPVAMTALFVFISIPILENRSRARRPGWAAHARRVSALIPWPPREPV